MKRKAAWTCRWPCGTAWRLCPWSPGAVRSNVPPPSCPRGDPLAPDSPADPQNHVPETGAIWRWMHSAHATNLHLNTMQLYACLCSNDSTYMQRFSNLKPLEKAKCIEWERQENEDSSLMCFNIILHTSLQKCADPVSVTTCQTLNWHKSKTSPAKGPRVYYLAQSNGTSKSMSTCEEVDGLLDLILVLILTSQVVACSFVPSVIAHLRSL